MPASAARVLVLALVSRAVVLGGMFLSDWTFADLDSSARLQTGSCAAAELQHVLKGSANQTTSPGLSLAVWDTVYFGRVAKCGYETDKINAFFPLLPAVMRTLGGALTGLARVAPVEAAYTLAALAVNVAAFCCAALCLHRLSLRVLAGCSSTSSGKQAGGSANTADLALLLFCLNPASVFYSAAYSEALFAACTWAGLLLLPSHHWVGVAALTAAAAARSNGMLGVWFPLHKLLVTWRQQGRLPLREAARAALSCCAILAPYAAMQAQAYAAHCSAVPAGAARPAWCGARLPSVYAFIQRQYWDVGLLRFYRDPVRLPMVLMSLPVAWLSVGGCWAYFAADWRRALTLGLFSRHDELPAWLDRAEHLLQRLLAAVSPARGMLSISSSRSSGTSGRAGRRPPRHKAATGAASALQASQQAAPLVYHWALMTAVALLAMHVNVATRFLSACPPLYWHAAEWAARGTTRAGLLWLWCLGYIALGCLLFPNFYPWC